jgi:hypothetical protein
LQFHFNEVIFSEETAMYAAEGVPTESVVFEDNAECVRLIEGGTLCAAAVSCAVSCVACGVVQCSVYGLIAVPLLFVVWDVNNVQAARFTSQRCVYCSM